MTIPMDNTSDNISRECVQRLYNKNVELENRRRKAAQARVPSDPNSWQQMRENYEAIILEDHAFSEQHEIEHTLWQLHYRRIEELRAHFNAALSSSSAQNGKAPTRPGPERVAKIRSQFKTFLSEATGFYHDLMVKIRAKYGLPLNYFSDEPGYQNGISNDGNRSVEAKKGLISCHRCLIYLGDLARYKGLYGEGDSKARNFAAASSYYMQASSIWPSSGNPHHQLAILASYSGDELVAVYQYFRSLAVDNPFTTARDNLIIAFEKNRQTYSHFLGAKAATVKPAHVRMTGKGRSKGETRVPTKDSKPEELSVKEKVPTTPEIFKAFGIRFVRLNGILFTRTSLETFEEVFSCAKNDMLKLLSSGPDEQYNFGPNSADCGLLIVRVVAILIFTVHNVNRETENQSYAEILQRSVVLKNAFTAIFEFIGHIIERCIQLKDPSSSYFMPGILIFVEWLACRQDVAVNMESEEREANARSLFWNNCVTFFNRLLKSGFMFGDEDEDDACFYNMSRYEEGETANQLALTEDFELRGFSPLVPAQIILDFSRKHSFGNDGGNKEKKSRIQRIIAAGKALASSVRVGQHRFYFDSKLKQFSIGVQPTSSDEVGQENLNLFVPLPQTTAGLFQPNAEMYVEGEEEDEVILFKPSVVEKTESVSAVKTFGSVSAPNNNLLQQNSIDSDSRTSPQTSIYEIRTDNVSMPPPISLSEISSHYMQPLQQRTSKWLAEECQSSITNGFVDLNLFEFQDRAGGGLQPAAATVPFPQTINVGVGNRYHHPSQVSETTVPSKFDSIMSSEGGGTDALYTRPRVSAVTSAGLKKNPVGRPIRHFGPPPGFKAAPHKPLDEPVSGTYSNSVWPLLDDHSWLDGHRFPKAIGFNNSVNPLVSKSSDPMGVVSFPFPGKQVPRLQPQMESQNGLPEYQFSEHLNLYQQQQQQLQNGNQQSVSVPQQYQGHTLWEGHFV